MRAVGRYASKAAALFLSRHTERPQEGQRLLRKAIELLPDEQLR